MRRVMLWVTAWTVGDKRFRAWAAHPSYNTRDDMRLHNQFAKEATRSRRAYTMGRAMEAWNRATYRESLDVMWLCIQHILGRRGQ